MVRPINRSILVQKCTTGVSVQEKSGRWYEHKGITVPQVSHETSMMAEVIDVASDCRVFSREVIGRFVKLPEWAPGSMQRVTDELFLVREGLFADTPRRDAPCAVFG